MQGITPAPERFFEALTEAVITVNVLAHLRQYTCKSAVRSQILCR